MFGRKKKPKEKQPEKNIMALPEESLPEMQPKLQEQTESLEKLQQLKNSLIETSSQLESAREQAALMNDGIYRQSHLRLLALQSEALKSISLSLHDLVKLEAEAEGKEVEEDEEETEEEEE